MSILLHPTYFPNIAHFVAMVQAENVVFEVEDNFLKQTFRNRTYIYGANGRLVLNIPVIHTQNNRLKYKDVKIYNEEKWQGLHWKSLLSAYKTSPFFEYYEDELQPLFNKKTNFILDFNFKCFEVVCECLQLNINTSETMVYEKDVEHIQDLRYLVNARKDVISPFDRYNQVFQEKHGFVNNLSILDLLFNEGPNALNYLESQTISPIQ